MLEELRGRLARTRWPDEIARTEPAAFQSLIPHIIEHDTMKNL